MKIYVDYRERELVNLLREKFREIEETNLRVGDIVLTFDDYAVILERKSTPDFIESVRSNRLWEQLLKMVKTEEIFDKPVERRILLLHGSIRELMLYEFDERLWASLSGAFMETVYVYGVPIFFIEDDRAVPTFIRILADREKRKANESLPKERWFRKRLSEIPEKDEKIYLLSSIPGIGNELAKNLLRHFGSIEKIAIASIEQLMMVDGIGNKKAEQIYKIFH